MLEIHPSSNKQKLKQRGKRDRWNYKERNENIQLSWV